MPRFDISLYFICNIFSVQHNFYFFLMLNLPSLRRQDLEQCDHQEKIRAHYDTIATSGLIGAFQYVLDDLSTDFQGRMTRAEPEKFFNDFTFKI